MRAVRLVLASLGAALVCRTSAVAADAGLAAERIAFPAGVTSVTKSGTITGEATHDYVVGGAAGQTLTVQLTSRNRFARSQRREAGIGATFAGRARA